MFSSLFGDLDIVHGLRTGLQLYGDPGSPSFLLHIVIQNMTWYLKVASDFNISAGLSQRWEKKIGSVVKIGATTVWNSWEAGS